MIGNYLNKLIQQNINNMSIFKLFKVLNYKFVNVNVEYTITSWIIYDPILVHASYNSLKLLKKKNT